MNVSEIAAWAFGIIGCVGVWYTFQSRVRREIVYVIESRIELFSGIVKFLPNISIKYMDRPVDAGLVLIHASFLNVGNADLNKSMVHSPMGLLLPDNFRWLEVKINSDRSSVDAKAKIADDNDRLIEIDFEYFQVGDVIRIEMLCAASDALKDPLKILDNKLRSEARIQDVRTIRRVVISAEDYWSWMDIFNQWGYPFIVLSVLLVAQVLKLGFGPDQNKPSSDGHWDWTLAITAGTLAFLCVAIIGKYVTSTKRKIARALRATNVRRKL